MTYIISTDATLAQLTADFNYVSPTPVKKFPSKAKASERLLKALDEHGTGIVLTELESLDPKSTAPAPAPVRTGKRTRLTASTVSVIRDSIPARPNSALFHQFAFIVQFLKKNPDSTVSDVYAAYNKDEDRSLRGSSDSLTARTFQLGVDKGLFSLTA